MTNAGTGGQRARVAIVVFVLLAAPMTHLAVAIGRDPPWTLRLGGSDSRMTVS